MLDYCTRLGVKPTGKNEDPKKLIDWFDDLGSGNEDYNFLSNFHEIPGGVAIALQTTVGAWKPATFGTTEHAFAAAKAADPKTFNQIAMANGPQEAKSLGRTCNLQKWWEQDKIDVMRQCLDAKFRWASLGGTSATDELAARLVDTGDALLVEGTWWHDTVWGVDLRTPGTPGRNLLGILLMARRAELLAVR